MRTSPYLRRPLRSYAEAAAERSTARDDALDEPLGPPARLDRPPSKTAEPGDD